MSTQPYRASPGRSTSQGSGLNSFINDPNTSGALVAVPPQEVVQHDNRASTIHHQLLVAEREIADLREDAAVRAAELEALRSALQREHEQSLKLQSKHSQDLEHMRSEYERQNSQLVEQLTLLKGVSDQAMNEKRQIADEATQQKQKMSNILDREREEKTQIMADYRSQTEALITEQGREITGLRNLLEAARDEEEKLIAATKRQEERRNEAEEMLLKVETQLSDERVTAQRRAREMEQRHQTQVESLRHQHELDMNESRSSQLKLTATKESAEDQVRSLTEKLKLTETASEHERQRLRSAYDTDIEALQQELKSVKTAKQANEDLLKAEFEREESAHEELVASLRREVEHARHERQAAFDEARVQKEVLVAENARRVSELQQGMDHARRELVDERTLRKDSEAARQSAVIENDAMKATISRLNIELENLQIDYRTRERNAEQQYHESCDKLRTALRTSDSDCAKARSTLQKLEVECARLEDELKSATTNFEQESMDARRKNEALRIELDDVSAKREEESTHATQQIDTLQSRKVSLEAEIARLERALTESEARNVAVTKQLSSERRALESATTEVQNLKIQLGDTNVQLEGERGKLTAALQNVSDKESDILRCREAISDLNAHVKEAQRQSDRLRQEMADQKEELENLLAAEKNAHRRDVSSLEEQLLQASKAKKAHQDAHQQAEEQVKVQRDELVRMERLGIEKDEANQEAIRHLRREHEEELLRMDTVVSTLRDDLARAQTQKAQAQREALDATRDIDRRVAIVQEALDNERASKQRIHDELRAKEQLIAEVQGTVRLLSTRMASKEDDIRRLEGELADASEKVHDAHSQMGKREATIGQLMAKLRVYESRGTL